MKKLNEIFEALGMILLLIVVVVVMIVFLPIAILTRLEDKWNHAKKKEEESCRHNWSETSDTTARCKNCEETAWRWPNLSGK